MASTFVKVLLLFISMLLTKVSSVFWQSSQVDHTRFQLISEEIERPWTMSAYDDWGANEEEEAGIVRRSLYWKPMHYYISYGALSANRIPCPPRSGRSYYTHDCFKTNQPANPYTRGCSRITNCRR
ncbi:hypothetical protein REPUB_Repub19eG0045900 [Reevesia pubescens]